MIIRRTGALIAALVGVVAAPTWAGPGDGFAAGVTDARFAELTPIVNARLGLADSSLIAMAISATPGQPLLTLIPIDGEMLVLDFAPVSVRSENFEIIVQHPDGRTTLGDPGMPRTLRGAVLGHPGSVAAGSLMDDGLHARILLADGRDLWIEPLGDRIPGAGPLDHVMYESDDVLESPGSCATDASMAAPNLRRAAAAGDPTDGFVDCAELACETDDQLIQALGESAAHAWIEQVVLMVNVQYERDVDITHEITAINLQSGSGDPYNNSPNASSLLNSFRNVWESSPPTSNEYDVAHMFTGRNLSGSTIGVAWVGAVCTSYRYGLVQTLFNGTVPNSCAYDLSAHELGHNWGAGHCSCSSPAYTMNSYITCANRFRQTPTIDNIIAFRDSRSCIGTCAGGDPTGACCLPTGCEVITEAVCLSQSGTYLGNGMGCSGCPAPTGACCLTDGSCTEGTESECEGTYQGDGTTCGSTSCGTPGDASVTCITYRTRGGPQQNKHLDVTVTVVDGGGNPVSGAGVAMTLTRSAGGSWSFSGSTGSTGEVTFTRKNAQNGCYTSDVTSLTGTSGNPSEPINGFEKGAGVTYDEDCISGKPDTCP